MISPDAFWALVGVFLVQTFVFTFGYGKLHQNVADLKNAFEKHTTNGQCTQHLEIANKIAVSCQRLDDITTQLKK